MAGFYGADNEQLLPSGVLRHFVEESNYKCKGK
jgi:hypothetical protein